VKKIVLVVFVVCTFSSEAFSWGAICYDSSQDLLGTSSGMTSKTAALNKAKATGATETCRTVQSGCVAFYLQSDVRNYFVIHGDGSNRQSAERTAESACYERTKNCRYLGVTCAN